ncbi:MAG TPA: chromosomal replication initiator DnaA, partial [Rickettsia endosymbiont of Bembidion nr. Transversale]|nr:chromosomal replication initiator DnaA [Rickettsia endosymbiont of Bembidion nr. Transversale]
KLYIKNPEKRFKNKFTFLSYMQKALKNEKHQGPLVNHTTFRFSCNIGKEEKNLLEYEQYLSQIENSFDTSKEMRVRKKIAGRFSTELAYKILTGVELKTNSHNSFITALIPSSLALSERQIATLSEQLEAVYGINGYYVTVFEDVGYAKDTREKVERKEELERQYSKIKESDIITNNKDIGSLESSKELDKIEENTVWNQIRQGLREELGEAIDEVWFSRAEATECRETGTLTLTMPTRFMSDFIKSRYSYAISRIARILGFIYIEYKSS